MEEKMKANSGKNRTLDEEIYWKHFNSVQFFQILPTNFHHHITLPTKFAVNQMSKLPQNAILKGPNGTTWHVQLLSDDSNCVMLRGDGWKEFVKAFALRKNDLLNFKYDRTNRCFEVLIFDETSSCEREASYFVQRCGLSQSNGGTDGKAKSRSSCEYDACSSDSTDHTDESDDESDEDAYRKSGKNKSTSKVNCSTRMGVPSNQPKKRKSFTNSFDENEKGKRHRTYVEDKAPLEQQTSPKVNGSTSMKVRPYSAASDRNSDIEVLCKDNVNTRKSPFVPFAATYKSNRRPITEAEKDTAYAKACGSATSESFIVIMRPSHVYRRFSMVIPQLWKPTSFSRNKSQEMILRIKDKTWVTSYLATANHGHGGIEGGWKKFALQNFLEEFDVCLFVPGGEDDKRFVLDVSIFRVVPEITPPSPEI